MSISREAQKGGIINDTTTVYDYAYDLAGRLIEEKTNSVITGTWAYDLNGNRTHVNGVLIATYDDQDRLLSYDGNSYTYTDNGELLVIRGHPLYFPNFLKKCLEYFP